MDYKENYKEALERAKKAIKECGDNHGRIKMIEQIFPELKESEDEKVRKEMINYFKSKYEDPNSLLYDYNKWIAWLEKQGKEPNVWHVEDEHNLKAALGYIEDEYLRRWFKDIVYAKFERQGEQKPKHFELRAGRWYICHRAFCCRADHLTVKEGELFMCERDGVVKGFVIKDPEKYFKEVCAPAPIEDEQKPSDNVDPKFKVGDWIIKNDDSSVNIDYNCCKITKVENGNYTIESIYGYKGYNTFETFEKDYHIWTIQDAKNGDVLCDYHEAYDNPLIFILKKFERVDFGLARLSDYSSYCFLTSGDRQRFKEGTYHHKSNIKPATKEQCDLLFQKMHEEGYEWDADKKELKKIEHNHADWNEDDETTLNSILSCIKHCQYEDAEAQYNGNPDADQERYEPMFDWLKSIKERVHPHPKQEWSKEDDYVYNQILKRVDDDKKLYEHDLEYIHKWFKSLKDRVQPQPKKEWSKDDEDMLNIIVTHIRNDGRYSSPNLANKYADFVLSLKHNHWKPSEEQMEALSWYCDTYTNKDGGTEILTSLYNDLKKL